MAVRTSSLGSVRSSGGSCCQRSMTRAPLALSVGEMRAVVIGTAPARPPAWAPWTMRWWDRWSDVPADDDEVWMDEVWVKEESQPRSLRTMTSGISGLCHSFSGWPSSQLMTA